MKNLSYSDFAKNYRFPYRDLNDKERIRALEERLYANEWALVEVRATREALNKLNGYAAAIAKNASERLTSLLLNNDGLSDADQEILSDIQKSLLSVTQ